MMAAVSLLLAFLIAAYLALPHFSVSSAEADRMQDGMQDLLDKKERTLQAIKDLDYDFKTGKVSPEEYASMKDSAARELSAVLGRIDLLRDDGSAHGR